MSDFTGIYDILAEPMRSITGSLTQVSGNLNVRRSKERASYDRLLQGTEYRKFTGETSSSLNQLATSPSWTQRNIGKNHAYVIGEMSCSQHEVFRLNTYNSGGLPLETTTVPASASAYYSKSNRFVKFIYKFRGDALTPENPGAEIDSNNSAVGGTYRDVSQFVAASGVFRSNTHFNPACFDINVAEYGKIRDIRVWVEYVNDTRNGNSYGIGGVQVALRSPNVSFHSCFPLWNNESHKGFGYNILYERFSFSQGMTGSSQQFGNFYRQVPEMYRSSYMLWNGSGLFIQDIGSGIGSFAARYKSWNDDLDMRTIFWDGSTMSPPHHLERLYNTVTDDAPGVSLPDTALASGSPNFTIYEEANKLGASAIQTTDYAYLVAHASGAFMPWFHDLRLPSGSIKNRSGFETVYGTSPPDGWLSGPGGTPQLDEFNTTGSNIGPHTIKPYLPLLDDVFEQYVYKVEGTSDQPMTSVKTFGFRPGLRGSEIHGTWRLMIATQADNFSPVNGFLPELESGIWFRQYRIEFIVDQGEDVAVFSPATARKYAVPACVLGKPGRLRRHLVSGSAIWNTGITYVYTFSPEQYGRSIGITSNTGSNISDFAVFSQITGSLMTAITGTQQVAMVNSFLKNEFGTPYIPLSSGSGENPSFFSAEPDGDLATRVLRDEILRPKTFVKPSQTLKSTLNRARFIRTSRDQVLDRLTVLGTFGNSSGSLIPL